MNTDNNLNLPTDSEDSETENKPVLHIEINTDDERYAEMCRLYWQHDENWNFSPPVTHIVKELRTTESHLTKTVKEFSFSYSHDDTCLICDGARIYRTRSEVARRNPKSSWTCSACLAAAKEKQKEEQRQETERRRTAIDAHYAHREYPFDIQELSLESCVYLLGFIRVAAPDELNVFLPLDLLPEPLSPSREYSVEILRHLYQKRLLNVHPSSPIDAFTFDDEGEPNSFFLNKVHWTLPTGGDLQKAKERIVLLEATCRKKEWPESWYEQTTTLWKRIAYEEVLQYLLFIMKEHDLPFSPGSQSGSKTELVLSEVLEEWSASQGICLCWAASKEAAAYYMRGKNEGLSKGQAANSVLGRIQRQSEQSRIAKREIKKFGRSWELVQSSISQVLFNAVLQIGELGFNEKPGSILFSRPALNNDVSIGLGPDKETTLELESSENPPPEIDLTEKSLNDEDVS